ncbi:MAG: insulinase family protein [Nitrospirota bacterium]|nr:insulinase family protein [Nitrospirota bacterium]
MNKKNLAVMVSAMMLTAAGFTAQAAESPYKSSENAPVHEEILANGLKVLVVEEHKSPVATFQVWYRVGAVDEQLGRTGLSHLLEHMMFKGTKKFGPKTFSQTVMKNGGNDNAFTSKDYTAYFENFASDRISLSMVLESDRMTNLLLDPKEFASERDVVKEERRMRYEDDPNSSLFEEVSSAAYKAHPYQWPVIGWMDDLSNMTRDDLFNHYKTYYAPNNATVIVVGDVKRDEIMAGVKKYFGDIPKGPEITRTIPEEPEQKGERRVTLRKEAQLPYIAAAYHVPNFKDADSYGLEVLSAILSGGKSSRLYKSLVYEKQIALFAGGDYGMVGRAPGLFYLYAGPMPGVKVEDLEKALYDEMEKLKNEPVADRELQKAKNQIEASFIMSQDSNFYRAMTLGRYEVAGDWRAKDRYIEGVRKVTAEDIQKVAKKYFSSDNRTVGILDPIKPKS